MYEWLWQRVAVMESILFVSLVNLIAAKLYDPLPRAAGSFVNADLGSSKSFRISEDNAPRIFSAEKNNF